MAYNAKLVMKTTTIDPDPISLFFLSLVTEEGGPANFPAHQEEELTTPGVDGRRWRTNFDQYRPFTMDTFIDTTFFSVAIDIKNSYYGCIGRIGQLIVYTSPQTNINVHVIGVSGTAMPGRTAGADVVPGAGAIVKATWNVVRVV